MQYAAQHPSAPHVDLSDQDLADSWTVVTPVDPVHSGNPDSLPDTYGGYSSCDETPESRSPAEILGAGTENEAVVEDYDSARSSIYKASLPPDLG